MERTTSLMDANSADERLFAAIQDVRTRCGEAVLTDRRRLSSLLSDLVPDARRQIRLLGVALDNGVPSELQRTPSDELPLHVQRLASRLENLDAIRPDYAHWAVTFWLRILGIPLPAGVSAPKLVSEPVAAGEAGPGPSSPLPAAGGSITPASSAPAPGGASAAAATPNAPPAASQPPGLARWVHIGFVTTGIVIALVSYLGRSGPSGTDDAGKTTTAPPPTGPATLLSVPEPRPEIPVKYAPGQRLETTDFTIPGSSARYSLRIELETGVAFWTAQGGKDTLRRAGDHERRPDANGNVWHWSKTSWPAGHAPEIRDLCVAAYAGRPTGISTVAGGGFCAYDRTCTTLLGCARMTLQ